MSDLLQCGSNSNAETTKATSVKIQISAQPIEHNVNFLLII